MRRPTGPRARALVAAGAALALVAACTSDVVAGHGSTSRGATTSRSPSPAPRSSLTFGDCGSKIDAGSGRVPSSFQMQCATVSVPLDYADPGGRQIQVAIVRLHQRGSSPTGTLLTDPGGPGGSGLQFAADIVGELPSAVTSHYDLVGFDPRGVGASTPIRCETDAQEDAANAAQPDIRTPAGFAEAQRLAQKVAQDCSAKYGAALAEFNTVQTAKDMDRIRAALGDRQLNYLGFSYGTELGAQYAHLFPSRVGAMVLDGAVDPLTDDITAFANQLDGFEKAFDQFAAWCPSHDPCRQLADPRQTVYQLADQARKTPLHSSQPGETRVATSSIVDLGVLYALYSQQLWPVLAQALIAAKAGDARILFQLADGYTERTNGHYTNVADSGLTINCNDSKPGPSAATIRATTAQWVKRFPMFGLWSAASLFACQDWQPKRTVPPLPTAPNSAHKILVIGNLHDPATPYQGAKDLTRTLGNAELLTWDGEGHTSYLQGSSCIDQLVDAFLAQDNLPPAGKTCPK